MQVPKVERMHSAQLNNSQAVSTLSYCVSNIHHLRQNTRIIGISVCLIQRSYHTRECTVLLLFCCCCCLESFGLKLPPHTKHDKHLGGEDSEENIPVLQKIFTIDLTMGE